LPIAIGHYDFPIIQYADDTLLILPVELEQWLALKNLLHHDFSLSIGLKVNFHKSNIVSIHVPDESMEILTNAFRCQVASLPFK
jgi:hypothetical protein